MTTNQRLPRGDKRPRGTRSGVDSSHRRLNAPYKGSSDRDIIKAEMPSCCLGQALTTGSFIVGKWVCLAGQGSREHPQAPLSTLRSAASAPSCLGATPP